MDCVADCLDCCAPIEWVVLHGIAVQMLRQSRQLERMLASGAHQELQLSIAVARGVAGALERLQACLAACVAGCFDGRPAIQCLIYAGIACKNVAAETEIEAHGHAHCKLQQASVTLAM